MTLRVDPNTIVEASASRLLGIGEGWRRVRLGDVAEVINGCAFSSKCFNARGVGLPLVRIRDVGSSGISTWYEGPYDQKYLVQTGDILVGMDGDFRVARWHGPAALLNQRVCWIRLLRHDLMNEAFMLYALPGYLDAIHQHTSSVTVKHLSSNTVLDIPLPLPPIAEQRRIVEVIEEQFSCLDAAESSLKRAAKQLQTLRERAFVFAANLNGVSYSPLGDIASIVGGVTKDAKRETDPRLIELPYLRVANVQRGFLDLTEVTTIRVDPAKADKLRLLPGDILFNEGGDRDKLGRGWIWEGQIADCIHQNHVFRARLDINLHEPKFISLYGNSVGREWFERMGRQTTNLASLNLTTLKSFPIPRIPIDVQRLIVTETERQMSVYDRAATEIESALERSQRLRRAVLEAAFSGRLLLNASSDSTTAVMPGGAPDSARESDGISDGSEVFA